jgi:hypothetical protein
MSIFVVRSDTVFRYVSVIFFGGTCCLHLQGRITETKRNMELIWSKTLSIDDKF